MMLRHRRDNGKSMSRHWTVGAQMLFKGSLCPVEHSLGGGGGGGGWGVCRDMEISESFTHLALVQGAHCPF